MSLDFAWIDKNSSNIYCIKRQLEVSLEKKNVKSRIAAYDEYYKRMCPGYHLHNYSPIFHVIPSLVLPFETNSPEELL